MAEYHARDYHPAAEEYYEIVKQRDTKIAPTPAGQRLAEQVVRRHRIAERFLTDMLGLHVGVAPFASQHILVAT
jgi:Mn-dependent DtxR family transcriptional regulator